jgi:hypothetical protein
MLVPALATVRGPASGAEPGPGNVRYYLGFQVLFPGIISRTDVTARGHFAWMGSYETKGGCQKVSRQLEEGGFAGGAGHAKQTLDTSRKYGHFNIYYSV